MQLLALSDIAHITIEPDICIAQRESTQHTRVFLLAYMRVVMNVKITAFERSKQGKMTDREDMIHAMHSSNNNDNKNSNNKKCRAHESTHNAPPRRECVSENAFYDRIEEKENLAWYFDCIRFSTM